MIVLISEESSMDTAWIDSLGQTHPFENQQYDDDEFPSIDGEPHDEPVKLPETHPSQLKRPKSTTIKMSAQDAATHLVPVVKKRSRSPATPNNTPRKPAPARKRPAAKPAATTEIPLAEEKEEKKKKVTDLSSNVGFGDDNELSNFSDTVGDAVRHMAQSYHYKVTAKICFIAGGKAYCLLADSDRVIHHISHETGYMLKTQNDPNSPGSQYVIVSLSRFQKTHKQLIDKLERAIVRKKFPRCSLEVTALPWDVNDKRGFYLNMDEIDVLDVQAIAPPPKRKRPAAAPIVEDLHVFDEFDTEVHEIPETP